MWRLRSVARTANQWGGGCRPRRVGNPSYDSARQGHYFAARSAKWRSRNDTGGVSLAGTMGSSMRDG